MPGGRLRLWENKTRSAAKFLLFSVLGLDNSRQLGYNSRCSLCGRFGCIAQLARACGSYPQCRRFDSYYSHHCLSDRRGIRPDGQAVKTPPFHGGITGSIPVRVTTPAFPAGKNGRIAQLVRAPASHAGGQRFEFVYAHQKSTEGFYLSVLFLFPIPLDNPRRREYTTLLYDIFRRREGSRSVRIARPVKRLDDRIALEKHIAVFAAADGVPASAGAV